ncbi:MAG: DUF1810 family protein [Verrucomicrobiota bacterium]
MNSFARFHRAQADRTSGYEAALNDIRGGHKTGHWIWYIFPQLEGLGRSATARIYALRDLEGARAYLRDPVLRARYEEIAHGAGAQLALGSQLEALLGSRLDALKFVSSLTLFRVAARSLLGENKSYEQLAALCDSLLEQARKQGYSPCRVTLGRTEPVKL